MEYRRDFALLPEDEAFLTQYGLPWETVIERGQWVLIHGVSTHTGYMVDHTSIAVNLTSGYPHAALDMVYVYPPLARKDGQAIPQTQVLQPLVGKEWQRWSRHRTTQNPWRPGEDSLETHIYLIEDWFTREFEK